MTPLFHTKLTKIGFAVSALLIIVLFAGVGMICSAAEQTSASTQTITDMAGKTVEIPTDVERVADLWHAHNEVVLMLGAGDKLVSTTSTIQNLPFFNLVYPGIKSVPAGMAASGEIDVEGVIATKPDVAIISQSSSQGAELLEDAHIPVVAMQFTTFEDMKKCFLLTGEILGEEEKIRAEKYIDYLDSKLTDITSVTSSLSEEKKPTVLHLQSFEPLKADGADTLIDTWINVAGGVNTAGKEVSGNMKEVSFEQIQKWNPDVIILGSTLKDKEKILNDPLWKDINAVKNNQVYVNPRGVFHWDRYGAEEALQIQWAAQTLHPDLFPNLDIKEELKSFYHDFFSYDLTDEEIESILFPEK